MLGIHKSDLEVSNDHPPNTTARPPFNDPDADVIICSADGVNFHVHKCILALASSIFKDMFALPQNLDASNSLTPTIPLTEDAETLDTMLRMCYPNADEPEIAMSLPNVSRMLEVADKYNIPGIRKVMRACLRAALSEVDPLRIYAIAYRWGLEHETRLAAKYSLQHVTIGPYVEELKHIPASAYHQLLHYHISCGKAAFSLKDIKTWIKSDDKIYKFFYLKSFQHDADAVVIHSNKVDIPHWFTKYMNRAGDLLMERPSTLTVADLALLAPYMQGIANDHANAYPEMIDFVTKQFPAAIEKAVSAVELKIDF